MIQITRREQLRAAIEGEAPALIIFTNPHPCLPEESLLNFFSSCELAKPLHDNMYVVQLVDEAIYDQFEIVNFPQVVVMKGCVPLLGFIGYNREKALEAINALSEAKGMGRYGRKLNIAKSKCKSNHMMEFVNTIDEKKYKNGCFECDNCHMLCHTEIDKPLLNCKICEFQVCYECSHDNVLLL